MTRDLSCRVVFLASPGGLDDEREVCRRVVEKWHATRALLEGVTFFIQAWEDIPGGVGRPQDLINVKLGECDYMILLLGDRWGSSPGGDTFTSGTEEEFYAAISLLREPDAFMRDVLVLFKLVDDARMRDPGRQLSRVLEFRQQLEESKTLMFETFDSSTRLEAILERKLNQWAQPLSDKLSIDVNLRPSSKEVTADQSKSPVELVEAALQFASAGSHVQAEAAFAQAIADRDPQATLAFAQYMRRTGRLDRALELDNEVLANPELMLSQDEVAFRCRVKALAGIGQIQRTQGKISQSLETLREAVDTADRSPEPLLSDLCYALDNYGHTLLRAGDEFLAEAEEVFERSSRLRMDFGDSSDRAQSAINLARVQMARQDYSSSAHHFQEALELLGDTEGEYLRSNALCGLAEARLRGGDAERVADHIQEAIDISGRLRSFDGLSIAHALMARYMLAVDEIDESEKHVNEVLRVSAESGNQTGLAVSAWLGAEIARRRGRRNSARLQLRQAQTLGGAALGRNLAADIAQTEALLEGDA